MRVRIDPAGGDEQTTSFDLALAGAGLAADMAILPSSIVTSPEKAAPPVPSMIVPPRMTVSCIVPSCVGSRRHWEAALGQTSSAGPSLRGSVWSVTYRYRHG
jgi:hypothetical protein